MIPTEDLGQHLEERIATGQLKPGTKMDSERKLAEEFGVGRPLVREALKRLEERGLIVTMAGRGSFVLEFQPWHDSSPGELTARRSGITALDLSRARQLLEGESAALAAENRTDEQLEDMREILRRFDAGGSVEDMAALDLAFHESIVIASSNVAIQVMFGSVRNMTKALMLRSLTDRAVSEIGVPIHHTVLEAIARRDPDAAREGMVAHLRVAETHYGADLDQPLADVLRRRALSLPAAAEALRAASSVLEEPLDGTDDPTAIPTPPDRREPSP